MPDPVSGKSSAPIQPTPSTEANTNAQNTASASKDLFEQLWEMLCGSNGFISNWNAFLAGAAETLNFYNSGLGDYTQLLDGMDDFSEASNNYDFNNWLASQTQQESGNYTGSATDAQNQCNDRITQAEKDKDTITTKQAQITAEQKQNDQDLADGKITQQQHDALAKQLDDTNTQLQGAYANVTKYITELQNMKFTDTTQKGQPATFKISGVDMTQFAKDEQAVSNDPQCGLTTIYNDTQNTATQYQTLSTTEQMEVSLIMNQTEQIMQIASSLQSSLFSSGDVMLKGIIGQ